MKFTGKWMELDKTILRCWELCGLVSDQHVNACLMDLHKAKPTEIVSHSARTRKTWDRLLLGPHGLHTLFSLIILKILSQ